VANDELLLEDFGWIAIASYNSEHLKVNGAVLTLRRAYCDTCDMTGELLLTALTETVKCPECEKQVKAERIWQRSSL